MSVARKKRDIEIDVTTFTSELLWQGSISADKILIERNDSTLKSRTINYVSISSGKYVSLIIHLVRIIGRSSPLTAIDIQTYADDY